MSLSDDLANLNVEQNIDLDFLKVAEATLKSNPNDASALQSKLVALIKLEKYEDGVHTLHKYSCAQKYPAEAAYIFYKTGKLEELNGLADLTQHSNPAVLLALAQTEYKAGNLSAAESLLTEVKKSDNDEDIDVDLNAIRASRGFSVSGQDFEAVFAQAYSSLLDPSAALDGLSKAKQLASDDIEHNSVLIQAAYVHAISGRADEAKSILDNLDSDLGDKSLDEVVRNNLLALGPACNTALAAQKALLTYDDIDLSTLTAHQASLVSVNKLALQYQAGRRLGSLANKHSVAYPHCLAGQLLALRQAHTVKELRKMFAKDQTNVAVALALATELSQEDRADVILEAAHASSTSSPAFNGLIVAALKLKNRVDQIPTFLRKFPVRDAFSACYLAQSPVKEDVALAKEYFSLCQNPSEKLAGQFLTGEAPEQAANSISDLVHDIDPESLYNQGVEPFVQRRRILEPTRAIHKKRSGKRRLPKNYDESKQPNPERWLPKMDRSSYKKKKKGASQGATQGSDRAASPATTVVTSAPKKNKKKKGKK